MELISIPMYTINDYYSFTGHPDDKFIKTFCNWTQRRECDIEKTCCHERGPLESCYEYRVRVFCERYKYEGGIHNPHKT